MPCKYPAELAARWWTGPEFSHKGVGDEWGPALRPGRGEQLAEAEPGEVGRHRSDTAEGRGRLRDDPCRSQPRRAPGEGVDELGPWRGELPGQRPKRPFEKPSIGG
jgi:hypothetical protein